MRDAYLVKQVLSGDKAAGERFVSEHYPRILRFLRNLTGNVEVAPDLTQQTFVKAWEALVWFRGESSLATWLHRIAYHEYTHWLRDKREHASLDDAHEVIDERAARDFEAVLLRRAMSLLSPDHREALFLFHVQGFSVQEVADVLQIPPGTVMSRLFNARARLRELLREPGELTENSQSKEAVSDGMPSSPSTCETC